MAKNKKGEHILTEEYEKHIQNLDNSQKVKYEFYDFH